MKFWIMVMASIFIQYALAYIATNNACVEWIKASPYCFYPLFFHAAILNFVMYIYPACKIQDIYFVERDEYTKRPKIPDRVITSFICVVMVAVNFIAFFAKMYPISAEAIK
jgi:hypothetical protein